MLDFNTQAALHRGEALPLMEAFYSLQGEGYWRGCAAYFIRLGGCDVGCHWCDVKESWPAEAHPIVPVTEIAAEALKHSKLIIITGGEPLMSVLDLGLHNHVVITSPSHTFCPIFCSPELIN